MLFHEIIFRSSVVLLCGSFFLNSETEHLHRVLANKLFTACLSLCSTCVVPTFSTALPFFLLCLLSWFLTKNCSFPECTEKNRTVYYFCDGSRLPRITYGSPQGKVVAFIEQNVNELKCKKVGTRNYQGHFSSAMFNFTGFIWTYNVIFPWGAPVN